jgi:hypothetical protein
LTNPFTNFAKQQWVGVQEHRVQLAPLDKQDKRAQLALLAQQDKQGLLAQQDKQGLLAQQVR